MDLASSNDVMAGTSWLLKVFEIVILSVMAQLLMVAFSH